MFTNPFSSASSSIESSSLFSSASSSTIPAGCRDYQRSSSIITLSTPTFVEGTTTVTKSTYMPRGARDYEKISPSVLQQSCVMTAPVLRRVPYGSLHYKRAMQPVAHAKRSVDESRLLLLEKDFQI